MSNGKTKIDAINVLASGIAFLFVAYISVVYILLMIDNGPNTLAYEIMSDYAINWAYRFVTVIVMYVCCLAEIISIPAYLYTKGKNLPSRSLFAKIQIIAGAGMFLCALLFWTSFGEIFLGDIKTPYATPYRILEIIFTPVLTGLLFLTIFYTPSDDVMKKLKKKATQI